ncbi:MAG: YhbY family RNA-binding protein [Candidatus Bathyarchaeota archaeon]
MTIPGPKRRKLKAQAHHLNPTIQIGKEGVTPAQIETIRRQLDHHELIKIKFIEHKQQRRELSTHIAQQTDSEAIDLIGNTLILYKQNPDPTKRKIEA